MRKLAIIFVLLAGRAVAQLAAVNGDCTIGGQQALTQGLASTATQQIGTTNVLQGAGVQASFPNCLVSVFVTNTNTLALIFSNSLSTPLANPFVANNDGSWTFFAAQGQGYDVVLSTGSGPSLPYSRTLPGIFLGGSGGGGGGISLINTILPITGGPITTAGTLAVNNATTATVGVIQLQGDLGGIGTAPTVVNGSHITNSSIANSALVSPTVTITPGTGLTGGGAVALGSSVTISLANVLTAGSCTNCSLNYNAQGQITVASSGAGGGGISGLGTTNFLPIFTSPTSLGNSTISNTNGTLSGVTQFGTAGTPMTGSLGIAAYYGPVGSCAGTSSHLLPTIGCTGSLVQNTSSAAGASGVIANFSSVYFQNSGNLGLGMAGYFSIQNTGGADSQGVHAESIAVGATTLNRGLFALAGANGAGATPTNEAISCQTQVNGMTVTNNTCLHIYAPISLTSGTNAGILIDTLGAGTAIKTGTDPVVFGGALTVAGAITFSSLVTGCLQSTAGAITSTGLGCGGGGSGSVITINGGGALASPTDFRNSTAGRIVNGVSVNFFNPTGAEVEASITGPATNGFLANSSVTALGTANQITVTGGGPLNLGGSATWSITTNPTLPGKTTLTASTTSLASLNIPTGVKPTSPVSGDVWNLSGIVHFWDSVNDNSFVTIQTPLVNGHIPKANGTNGLLSDGYGVQGTGSNVVTSGTLSGGAGTPTCIDGSGTLQTTGCNSTDLSGMVANGVPIANGPASAASSLNSNIAGQVLTFQNGTAPTATSPSLQDSVNSPVTSASYTLACDTATALVDRAHTVRFQSGAVTPIVPAASASGCAGFVNTVIDDSAGALVFGRTGTDTFNVYNGATTLTGQTSFTLNNGQYATLNNACATCGPGSTALWEVLVKTNSSLPSGTQGQTLVNTTGSNAYATSQTLGIDLAQFSATIPFTTGNTTPTVDVTAAFNALLATLPVGSRIVFPPNSHYKFAPVAGAQAAVPLLRNGFKFECGGGPGGQYTAALATAECSLHMATAGGYVFGVGQYAVGPSVTPTAGPQFINMTFVDDTAKSNAGGQIYVADTNNVLVDNATVFGGWRQPAVAVPSAPTCAQTASGGSLATGAVRVKLAAWTTSGPTLPSAATACSGTPPAGNVGTVSITIPSPVAPIIGYEAYCAVGGSTTLYQTCSPLPTYTTNGDGSQTINLQTATPLVVTAITSTRTPMDIDLSHSGGMSFNGSVNWTTAQGFSNGPRVTNLKSYLVQGAVVAGVGAASVNVDKAEVSACDVVVATGACGAGSATPGLVIGMAGLRLTNTHGSAFNANPSTGPMITVRGFNNTIIGGTIQSNTAGCPGSCSSTEIGVSMVNATGTVIRGLVLANFGTGLIADANSSGNSADFADNGTNLTMYTDNGTGNEWCRAGKTCVFAASTTAGASINLPHGVAPTSPINGDIWTTTTGQFDRINGTTQQMATQTYVDTNACEPGAFTAQTDGATVTWAIGTVKCANASLTFTVHSGSRTLNLTGLVTGGSYVIKLIQDGTGGENLTGGTGCTWKQAGGGGTTFTLTNSAGALDVLAFMYDGTNCLATLTKAFS